jgi:hypothetical protein
MENPNESMQKKQRDYTLPLFLTGMVTAMICAVLCVISYLSRDFISKDVVPRLGLVDPTPLPPVCPLVKQEWKIKQQDDFINNWYEWPVGRESNIYGEYNTSIKDGEMSVAISTTEGSFYNPTPGSNQSLTDFYLTTQLRQATEVEDAQYGLAFREDASIIYFFFIINESVVVQQWDGKQWDQPLYNTYPGLIKSGEMNEMSVLHSEDQMIFCVNDVMTHVLDETGYIFGNFGVGIAIPLGAQKATFAFDNFRLYVPVE